MANEILNKEEWEAAMRTILAAKTAPSDDDDDDDKKSSKKMPPEFFSKKFKKKAKDLLTEIPAGGGWTPRVGKPDYTKNTTTNEIPNNHPAGTGSPITPADKPVDNEIPAGGGFTTRVGRPQATGPTLKEIPANHPAGTKSSRTPLEWAAGSINYGTDTSVGWAVGKQLPTPGKTVWGQPVAQGHGGTYSSLPPDGKTTSDTLNKAPRSSIASEQDDLGTEENALSLPDGSFFIAQPGDLSSAIAKVQNADKTNPRPQHPSYIEVKRHIARRAADMGLGHTVPADWQVSMAMHAEAEIARKFDEDSRKKLASSGAARPDGSYPIVNSEDLHNAIQAYGRSNPGDRSSVKAHILKRAKALGAGGDLLKHISGLGKADSK